MKKIALRENRTVNALSLCFADTVDVVRHDDECMALSASSLPRHNDDDDSDTLE